MPMGNGWSGIFWTGEWDVADGGRIRLVDLQLHLPYIIKLQNMGVQTSRENEYKENGKSSSFVSSLFFRHSIPINVSVAHFTPSTFPLMPTISPKATMCCRESWTKILAKNFTDENGTVTAGLTLFYNRFYETLDKYDGNKDFESILTQNCKGSNKIAAKANVLIKIITYVLKIEEASPKMEAMLHQLGKRHDRMQIRPWQYATYIQTVLLTIAERLESDATYSVMESWVNLFAYVFKFMLPSAIRNAVHKSEFHFECSTESANLKIQRGIQTSSSGYYTDALTPTNRSAFTSNKIAVNTPKSQRCPASLSTKSDSTLLGLKNEMSLISDETLPIDESYALKPIKEKSFTTGSIQTNSFKICNMNSDIINNNPSSPIRGSLLSGLNTPMGSYLLEHVISSIDEENVHDDDNHNNNDNNDTKLLSSKRNSLKSNSSVVKVLSRPNSATLDEDGMFLQRTTYNVKQCNTYNKTSYNSVEMNKLLHEEISENM
eukprot:gene13065-27577_t